MPESHVLQIAVLVSGGGTTLQNLIDRIADGRLAGIRITRVIASRSTIEAIARAQRAGIPVDIIRRKDFADIESFSQVIGRSLDASGAQLAVLAGWLPLIQVATHWMGRVINLHPALLPAFGGKGFHGLHVHEAVLAAGCRQSGATVHYVDNEYDHGPIIRQDHCAVHPDDTATTLAARVGELERELLPSVLCEWRDRLIKHSDD